MQRWPASVMQTLLAGGTAPARPGRDAQLALGRCVSVSCRPTFNQQPNTGSREGCVQTVLRESKAHQAGGDHQRRPWTPASSHPPGRSIDRTDHGKASSSAPAIHPSPTKRTLPSGSELRASNLGQKLGLPHFCFLKNKQMQVPRGRDTAQVAQDVQMPRPPPCAHRPGGADGQAGREQAAHSILLGKHSF